MSVERHIELQDRLREVLGEQPAATLWGMLPGRDDLATKSDLSEVENTLRGEITELGQEIKGEIAELMTDVATLRTEMAHRYATKEDLFVLSDRFNEVVSGHVRTFNVVQAATVVGMSSILFGLLRFF